MADNSSYLARLRDLLRERAFRFGKFVLTSGKESNYYFDGKQVTLHPEGAYLLAKIIIEKIRGGNIQAVGGPTIGADPIVGALAAVAHLEGLKIKLFIVRKATKEHGMKKLIEGPELSPGERVAIVEDVMTTGSSIMKAVDAVRETGCRVVKVIPLVDRLEGGTEKLRSLGIAVDPVFTIRDFGL
ncbi:MAG: orotate phosphoribosyltransferase [Bacillota bacterium]